MIKFIFKHIRRVEGGSENEIFFTIDAQNKEVERALTDCGYGENGYKFVKLIGAEVIKDDE